MSTYYSKLNQFSVSKPKHWRTKNILDAGDIKEDEMYCGVAHVHHIKWSAHGSANVDSAMVDLWLAPISETNQVRPREWTAGRVMMEDLSLWDCFSKIKMRLYDMNMNRYQTTPLTSFDVKKVTESFYGFERKDNNWNCVSLTLNSWILDVNGALPLVQCVWLQVLPKLALLTPYDGEDEKKLYDNVPRSRAPRVLSSMDNEKTERNRYTFRSSTGNSVSPDVWKSFDAKKNYIGVVDIRQNVCWVEDSDLIREVENATLHKRLMLELGLWKWFEKSWKLPRNHADLFPFFGFANQNGEWKGHSCTLNAGQSDCRRNDLRMKALVNAGRKKGDLVGKDFGVHKMRPLRWMPLKAQLDEMTK